MEHSTTPGEVTISRPGVGGGCSAASPVSRPDLRNAINADYPTVPKPGERRLIQFNWVTSEEVVRREQNRHRFSATVKKLLRPFATHA